MNKVGEKDSAFKEQDKNAERSRKWREENKERFAYLRARSSARSFVRNRATQEDMKELIHIFETENENAK